MAIIETGALVGIHAIQGGTAVEYTQEAVNRGFTIPVVKAVDDVGWLNDIGDISPETIIIARFTSEWEGCQGVESMDTAQLNELADKLMEVITTKMDLNPGLPVDYWEVVNEPNPPDGYPQLSELMILCMERADNLGIKLAIFSLNAGTPEYSDMEEMVASGVFQKAKSGGHILCLHEGVLEADWPIDQWWGETIPGSPVVEGAGALCFRYRYLYDIIPEDAKIELVVSEMYYQAYDDPADAVERATWYDNEAMKDWYFLGCLPFTIGPVGWWVNQNYEPMYPGLLDYMESVKDRVNASPPTTEPPVEPPPGPVNLLANYSFEDGYYHLYVDDAGIYYEPWNRPTNIPTYAVPELQVANNWLLDWEEGENELNPEYPWVRPETRVLPYYQLPDTSPIPWGDYEAASERELFIIEGEWTVKIFKGSGAINWSLETIIGLEEGKEHQFKVNLFPDLVVGYNNDGTKIWAMDRGGEMRFLVNDVAVTDWMSVIPGEWNELSFNFTTPAPLASKLFRYMNLKEQTLSENKIGIQARGRWALQNNGWFMDAWELYKVSAPIPEPTCTRDYLTSYFLTPQSLTNSERALIGDWVYNGITLPGGSRTNGRHVWSYSHLDAIDSVLQGKPGSRLYIVNHADIGTGLTLEWLEENYPAVVDRVVFVYT